MVWAACPLEHFEKLPDFLPLSSNVSFDFPDACHPASAAAAVPRDAADAGVLHEAWGAERESHTSLHSPLLSAAPAHEDQGEGLKLSQ